MCEMQSARVFFVREALRGELCFEAGHRGILHGIGCSYSCSLRIRVANTTTSRQRILLYIEIGNLF